MKCKAFQKRPKNLFNKIVQYNLMIIENHIIQFRFFFKSYGVSALFSKSMSGYFF